MDIDRYKLYALYELYFNGICSDVYDHLDLNMNLISQIKLCVLRKHGAMTYKNTTIEVICR